jgi:lysophospholipase L1-like esterase
MRMSTRVRRTLVTIAAATLVVTGTLSTASAANAAISPVGITKIAALGDSITQALMTCSSFSGCPVNSWSTGTTTSVGSHLLKIRGANPGVTVTASNNAVSGALSSGLNAQAQKAVTQGAQYVTIEIGANDACTSTVAKMTPVETYRTNIKTALATLNPAGTTTPRQVFVASVPNLYNMYLANKGSSSARFTWSLLRICQSMLANPSSTSATDNARRAQVLQRVVDYNTVLAQECANYTTCRFDGNAVFGAAFTSAHISTRDYFHPSLLGQTLLASTTWPKTQWAS